MKKLLAIFLAFAMMASVLPVTAMAEDTSQTTGTTDPERIVQSSMKISVDEIVKVEEDGTVTLQDVELAAVGAGFAVDETLTLTLSSGFGFHATGEEDSDYVDIDLINKGEKLELTFKQATGACNISNMEIDALKAPVGEVAILTVESSGRGTAATEVAIVISEIKEEKEKTVVFEIGSNDIEVNGKAVTISEPTPAIWTDNDGNVMIVMRAASQILQKLDKNVEVTWDTNAMAAEYSIGNETVKLTVGSDIAVVNGKDVEMETECIIQAYGEDGYVCFPMEDFFEAFGAEDWAVKNGKGGFNLEFMTKDPYMTLDIPKLQILKKGTVSYDIFGVDTRYRDFELDEIVTLTISEGFEFVPAAIHDHDGTILQNVEWSADGKTVKVPVYKTYDSGFDMETMTIKATTAKVGDEALLTVSAEHYPDVSKVIAVVVDEITETPDDDDKDEGRDPYMFLDIPELQILEGGTVSYSQFNVSTRYRDFKLDEIVTLTISEGFEFVPSAIHDHDGTILQNVEWSADGKTVKVPVYKYEDTGFDMEAMTIRATTAEVGDEALLTVSAVNYPDVSQVIATVVSEIKEEKTVLFEIKSNEVEVEGETLTIDRPASAIWVDEDDNVMIAMRAATQILQKLDKNVEVTWDTNAMAAEYSIGNKTVKLTVGSDIAVVNGKDVEMETVCIMQDYADGGYATFPMKDFFEAFGAEDWAVKNGKGGFNLEFMTKDPYMTLDIPELKILKGGAVSYDTFGVDTRYRDFKLGEIVTLTISEGFEFVPSAIHDHDDTVLQNVVWSKDGKTVEVPVYKYEDTGFDMEGMTIKATTANVGDTALLTVSAEHYPDVSQVIATVVSEIKEEKTVLFEIKSNEVEVEGETLTIDRPASAIWVDEDDNVMIAMRAATQILQKLNKKVEVTWDTNAMAAEYSIGNKTVVLTVGSDVVVVNGKNVKMETACIMKDYADGGYATFPMKDFFEAFGAEDWDVKNGEGGFDIKIDTRVPYMFLDIPELQIREGGTVSYSQFNVSTRYRDFKLDEIVTLTISEGFEFVPSAIHDHDGTILQNVVWSADGKTVKVPVYKYEDTGFDMETMTIKATTANVGDEAVLTVSAKHYPDVSKVIATVVKASSSSGGGGGSSNKTPATTPTETTPAVPPVTTEGATTENGQTSTVDTTATTVQPVSKAEKETYQAQLKDTMPAATAVGEGAYTFAVADAEPSTEPSADATSGGNTSNGVKDPEKVSIDLSGQNLEDTAHLTLVKYVTQPDGTVEVVKLGGTFDPETNTFSAYADGEGVYDLVHDPDVTKITFAIGQTEVSTNDAVQNSDVAPVLHENKTMVPLRVIAETLGAKVEWDEATKSVRMIQGDTVIVLEVDGEDGTAMIMNDRTMVQLRYIGENFGASVRWIPSTQSIEIVK